MATTAQKPTLPVIHINGSGQRHLLKQVTDAAHALRAALAAHAMARPSGRDYDMGGEHDLQAALQEHEDRGRRLSAVLEEQVVLARGIARSGMATEDEPTPAIPPPRPQLTSRDIADVLRWSSPSMREAQVEANVREAVARLPSIVTHAPFVEVWTPLLRATPGDSFGREAQARLITLLEELGIHTEMQESTTMDGICPVLCVYVPDLVQVAEKSRR